MTGCCPGRLSSVPVPSLPRVKADTPSTHRSLERGLAVLEAVAEVRRPISLADTARRVGLHRSTAHHLLQALVRVGYLTQDAATRGYLPSPRLFRLGAGSWTPEVLARVAGPQLEALSRETGACANVAMWVDGRVRIDRKSVE